MHDRARDLGAKNEDDEGNQFYTLLVVDGDGNRRILGRKRGGDTQVSWRANLAAALNSQEDVAERRVALRRRKRRQQGVGGRRRRPGRTAPYCLTSRWPPRVATAPAVPLASARARCVDGAAAESR